MEDGGLGHLHYLMTGTFRFKRSTMTACMVGTKQHDGESEDRNQNRDCRGQTAPE